MLGDRLTHDASPFGEQEEQLLTVRIPNGAPSRVHLSIGLSARYSS
jgi:hypothetical protein